MFPDALVVGLKCLFVVVAPFFPIAAFDLVGKQSIDRLRDVHAQFPGGFKHLGIEREIGGFFGRVGELQHGGFLQINGELMRKLYAHKVCASILRHKAMWTVRGLASGLRLDGHGAAPVRAAHLTQPAFDLLDG